MQNECEFCSFNDMKLCSLQSFNVNEKRKKKKKSKTGIVHDWMIEVNTASKLAFFLSEHG